MSTQNNPEKTSSDEVGAKSQDSASAHPHVALNRFAKTFESSAKRWEMIVYPSMFGFIMLAAYGFFLIYNVTRDMHELAKSMDPAMHLHMKTMAQSISEMTKNVATITTNMNQMTENMKNMDATVGSVNTSIAGIQSDMGEMSEKIRTLEPMLVNVSEMNKSMHMVNQSVHSMAANTGTMSRDVGATSYHFVRPMSAINSFFPW
uniref:Methyl-accepting chemotaxis protein n=1 Tax=Candidatus Kentrum eta TaxID=2126337 RepID=A0A450VQ95_9GAMM|nr:MAG: hypothetical protein BECKH772B_GA0070898_103825 [Candidatus Kentron sp. H]VFK04256.1 MAG: hypothetical protein BECKH772A_GA0070896_103955 [Candidatus Kentron sp. H]VFK06946.1 MAG: hypothetical protein BECKH772C_GA0070978_103855 [Candidatus Kentron sp. H]